MARTLAQHKSLWRAFLLVGVLAGLVLGAPTGAWATSYTFTTLDPPGGGSTYARAINAAGQVVGLYSDGTGAHGFLYSGGTYTTLTVPGSVFTDALAINAAGQVTGIYRDATKQHGYLFSNGTYTTLDESMEMLGETAKVR
jgi:probable HAF family extracellular repeat protein